MIKLFTSLMLLLIIISCSNRQSNSNENYKSKVNVDTIDVNSLKPKPQKSEFIVYFLDKNGTQDTTTFTRGDTLYMKLVYKKKKELLNHDFKFGLISSSNNLSIHRISKDEFRLIISKNTKLNYFNFESYIYSKNIFFDGAYNDTITGVSKNRFCHSFGLIQYAYEIEE